MTLGTALTTVVLDPALQAKLPETVQRDCQTILSEIQRDAAMFLADGTPLPYQLFITASDQALVLRITNTQGAASHIFNLYFSKLRGLMGDYDLMIGAHGSALRHQLGRGRTEAIDMGRRAMHNEGAELILEQLAPDLTADLGTARLLFTLMFLLTQRR